MIVEHRPRAARGQQAQQGMHARGVVAGEFGLVARAEADTIARFKSKLAK